MCRIGILVAFLLFFLRGMFTRQVHSSSLHKFGYYIYPVILISYMIAECGYWAAGSFPYVSAMSLLNEIIPLFFISFYFNVLFINAGFQYGLEQFHGQVCVPPELQLLWAHNDQGGVWKAYD